MASKQYDYRALLHAHVKNISLAAGHTKADRVNEDPAVQRWLAYHALLDTALQELLGTRLTREEAVARAGSKGEFYGGALWILFEATIRSYIAIRTPMTGFLEFSNGEVYEIYERSGIDKLTEENKAAHWSLLYELFQRMYGKVETVVTSEMLLAAGVDDSQEAQMQLDYWDAIV